MANLSWNDTGRAHRSLIWLLGVALAVHLCMALAAADLPEMGDISSFKLWADRSVETGIHRAYASEDFRYDWLPLYLYVSKLVGLFYRYSGLWDHFGPYSRPLTLLLKGAMICLNVVAGWAVYRLVERIYGTDGRPLWAAAAYLFNPAIALATDVFGYQDALHTALVCLAVLCLCADRGGWTAVWAALAFLAKPQAAIFLLPIGAFLYLRKGPWGVLRGVAAAALTTGIALSPFIVYGEMAGVLRMYLGVTRVHQWLTGCAHNIWWIFRPAPPFHSDRASLLLGMNGLAIGLLLLTVFSLGTLYRLLRRPTLPNLVHLCAFLGLAFFMLPTEMHENYLYAMFPFLSAFVCVSARLRWLYIGLTVTFALDMALTLWLLHTGVPAMLGPVRVSIVNAVANTAMLLVWSYLVFVRKLQVERPER